MKFYLFLLLLFTISIVQAQKDTVGLNLPMEEGNVKFQGIVNTTAKDKDQLYSTANQWIVKTFNDSRDVLEIQDKSNGELMGKGNFYIKVNSPGSFGLSNLTYKISFVLQIDVKENKYRYIFSTIEVHETSGLNYTVEKVIDMCYHGIARKTNRLILESVSKQINMLIISLNNDMLKNNTDF